MPRIIGGMMGMGKSNQPFNVNNSIYVLNARSALFSLIKLLNPKKIWIPSYTCESLLHERYPIQFYPVKENLKVKNKWIKNIQRGDLVLLINYFGFYHDNNLILQIKNKGAKIIEDSSQGPLSKTNENSDFILFSTTKQFEVPDGGVLKSQCEVDLSDINLKKPPKKYTDSLKKCRELRTSFDNGENNDWFKLYKKLQTNVPVGLFSMTSHSVNMLSGFDENSHKENYKICYKQLKKYSILGELKDGVVPMGFPIKVEDRDELQRHLFSHNIYLPVHWRLNKVPNSFTESYNLSKSIITIVCDRRYKSEDMNRVIYYVKNFIEN